MGSSFLKVSFQKEPEATTLHRCRRWCLLPRVSHLDNCTRTTTKVGTGHHHIWRRLRVGAVHDCSVCCHVDRGAQENEAWWEKHGATRTLLFGVRKSQSNGDSVESFAITFGPVVHDIQGSTLSRGETSSNNIGQHSAEKNLDTRARHFNLQRRLDSY